MSYKKGISKDTVKFSDAIDNLEEAELFENSVYTNKLRVFTPINTLQVKDQPMATNMPQIGPGPSAFRKANSTIDSSIIKHPALQLSHKDSEQLQLQGAQTPNMQDFKNIESVLQQSNTFRMASGQIRTSTIINQSSEQANSYLKEIEAKNQNKVIGLRDDLEIFKYLSLTYNVNTIVDPNFLSTLKYNLVSPEVQKLCIDSVKISNKISYRSTMQTLLLPQPAKANEQAQEKAYKNILTSLLSENKSEQQLLVVEFANMGGTAQVPTTLQHQTTSNYNQRQQEISEFLQQYKAFPMIYHLNFESSREVSPFIAIDRISGRHFIYNNDDTIMVFSHEPIKKSQSDKSRPLLYMSLEDTLDHNQQKASQMIDDNSQQIAFSQQITQTTVNQNSSTQLALPRINPTLQIVSDSKGNSALLVIGGYVELPNGTFAAKKNIKVFNIGKIKMDIKPSFSISLKHPRINPIVMKVKSSDCKDAKLTIGEDKKYLILLGGALLNVVEDKKVFTNTNTQCSVIEYDTIFNQLKRKEQIELAEQKTLKVFYNDRESGKNYDKLANQLARGVFIFQKGKKNSDIHNKMFIACDKKKQLLHVNAISLQENFISLFDADCELKAEHSWNYTNMCSVDNYIICISPLQTTPIIIETNTKNCKQMNSEDVVEFNQVKKKKDIFDIKPKKSSSSCKCTIF